MTSSSQHAPADMEALIQDLRDQLVQLQGQVQTQQNTINAMPAGVVPAAPQNPTIQNIIPAPRIKPDRPPPFLGKKSESLETWIFQMEQFCEVAQVAEDDRIPFATTFFKDQAALWWRHYHQSLDRTQPLPTWEEFLDVLRRHFVPVNTSINAYERLRRLTQKTSVNAYNHEFRSIMLELPDMDNASRMDHYMNGLKDNIRPFVAMQCPTNLATAETIAERVDATTFKPINRNPGFRSNPGYRTPGGPTPMELDVITKLTPAERDRLRKIGGCFRCRQAGHLARDCPLPNRSQPRINAIDITESTQSEESGKD